MSRKNFWYFIIFSLISTGVSLFFFRPADIVELAQSRVEQQAFVDRQKVRLKIGISIMLVEIVNTPESITLGLSGRDEIGADGMLFLFDFPRKTSFWMKDMRFDLDMIWILDGQVVGITEHVPAPKAGVSLDNLETYPSTGAVDAVLEVAAGQAQRLGIVVGDRLELLESGG